MWFPGRSYCFLVSFLCLITHYLSAQDQRLADSLARIYRQEILEDSAKLELLRNLSFNEMKDPNLALRYAEELIRLSQKKDNQLYLYRGYLQTGNIKRRLGNLEEALDAFFKSGAAAHKAKFLPGEGTAYGAIADIYSISNHHRNAMLYYNKAIATLRRSTDSVALATTITNAGDEFFKARIYDSALLYFNEAKEVFDKANHQSGKGYSLGNIGMVYASIGKNTLAERNINEAIHILEETQDYYPICDYLISMSDVYVNKGDSQTALNYTLRSLHLAEQHGLKEQVAEASLKLSELYEKAGDTNEAFKHYKKHIVYRDSINNLKAVQGMADQRTDFEVAQKQAEVNMLNREKHNQQTIVIFLFIILGLTIMLLGTLFWFYQFKSKAKLRLHQQELLHARLEIQEQTYRNISQELHDNIGQALSLVKININTVDINDSEHAREKLTESKNLLTKAIQDLRDISKTLNTDFINEIGLANAVEQQLQLLQRTGLYTTQLVVKGEIHRYEPHRELLIFRIVQELLNNIVKHAEANKIDVAMNYGTDKLIIKVWDNGKGFDIQTQQSSPNNGLGLRNIHNRLKLIKGAIYFDSGPDKGTMATIEILK